MVQTVSGARRRAAWLRLGRGLSQAERGQATLEYVGSLIAASVVVILVAAALAVPASRQKLASAVRVAVCAITIGQVCGSDPAAVAVDSFSGGGDSTSGQPATGGAKTDDWDCHGFWGCTWNGVKQVGSGGFNIGKGAVDDVVGIWDLAKDPGQVVDAGKYIWNHPWDSAKQLVWDNDSSDMWGRQDYGGAIGRGVWNVGSWFIPGVDIAKGASKFGKLGKLGKIAEVAGDLSKLDRLAEDAGTLARTAEKAAERGDTKAARDAATAARKKADEAEAEARSRGCPIAVGVIPAQRAVQPGLVLASGTGGVGHFGAGVSWAVPRFAADEGCGEVSDAAKVADEQADSAETTSRLADAAEAAGDTVPTESLEVIESIRRDGVIVQSGVKGPAVPKEFRNDGGTGGQVLPRVDPSGKPIEYREWGTIPDEANLKPGGERIVTGSDGSYYYSPDHYQTFVRVP
jgi:guanyl-specific ribonuclease Sa